ncbi:hypothetical protein CYMTET_16401 [Cymbomonas tetramitiformis]|uniref:Uncharacterized protein n=1 Tax=Cymbomonas tetramitiformis TaxID=36881 RepID=A0AAE0GCB5_9CHLO|nr:hypothetical protein CYMTET_16401 [Cymbomonas tetramitiformis]
MTYPKVNGRSMMAAGATLLVWEGTGRPCITCFRLWAVTTGHIDTEGICPYVCTQAFAPGRAPAKAPAAPANPPPPLSEWPPSAAPRADYICLLGRSQRSLCETLPFG